MPVCSFVFRLVRPLYITIAYIAMIYNLLFPPALFTASITHLVRFSEQFHCLIFLTTRTIISYPYPPILLYHHPFKPFHPISQPTSQNQPLNPSKHKAPPKTNTIIPKTKQPTKPNTIIQNTTQNPKHLNNTHPQPFYNQYPNMRCGVRP